MDEGAGFDSQGGGDEVIVVCGREIVVWRVE